MLNASKSKRILKKQWASLGIDFILEDINVRSEKGIDKLRVQGENFEYILKSKDDYYRVRQLSNTRNSNVIFPIALREHTKEQVIQNGFKEFEISIGAYHDDQM